MRSFTLFLFTGSVLVFVQSLPWSRSLPCEGMINLSLSLVIFLSLSSPSLSNWFLAFILGYLVESLSAIPKGIFPLLYVLSFLFTRVASRAVMFENLFPRLALLFAVGWIADIVILLGTNLLSAYNAGSVLKDVTIHNLLLALAGVPLLALFGRLASLAEPA